MNVCAVDVPALNPLECRRRGLRVSSLNFTEVEVARAVRASDDFHVFQTTNAANLPQFHFQRDPSIQDLTQPSSSLVVGEFTHHACGRYNSNLKYVIEGGIC